MMTILSLYYGIREKGRGKRLQTWDGLNGSCLIGVLFSGVLWHDSMNELSVSSL